MDSLDFKASRALLTLSGGDLALAWGGEYRREKQNYHQSEALGQGPHFGRKLARTGCRLCQVTQSSGHLC